MQFLKRKFSDTFSSLYYRNFRLLVLGHLVSLIGSWAQNIALSWVAYELTGSAVSLGIISFLSFGPLLLFGIFGGHLVDILPKYKTVIVTQVLHSIFPFIVAILFFTGDINVYYLYACAAVAGLLRIVDMPARQTLRYQLIPKEETKNSISLFSTTTNFARILGPVLAGILLAGFGPAWCFLVNGLSFLFVVFMMLKVDTSRTFEHENVNARKNLRILESLKYVWDNKIIRDTLILSTVVGTLFLNSQAFFPVFTKEIFNMGALAYSHLISVYSFGAVLGALYAAQDKSLGKDKVRRQVLFLILSFGLLALPVGYTIFSLITFVVGFTTTQVTNALNSLLITQSEEKYLGMVTSLWSMAIVGTSAIGGLIVGYTSEYFGIHYFTVGASVILLVTLVGFYRK